MLLLPSVSGMHNLPVVQLFFKKYHLLSGMPAAKCFHAVRPLPPSVHLVDIDVTHMIFNLRPSPVFSEISTHTHSA